MFGSRGLTGPAAAKGSEFEAALLKASDGGRIPIVMDTSPCLSTMKSALENPALKYETALRVGAQSLFIISQGLSCRSCTPYEFSVSDLIANS